MLTLFICGRSWCFRQESCWEEWICMIGTRIGALMSTTWLMRSVYPPSLPCNNTLRHHRHEPTFVLTGVAWAWRKNRACQHWVTRGWDSSQPQEGQAWFIVPVSDGGGEEMQYLSSMTLPPSTIVPPASLYIHQSQEFKPGLSILVDVAGRVWSEWRDGEAGLRPQLPCLLHQAVAFSEERVPGLQDCCHQDLNKSRLHLLCTWVDLKSLSLLRLVQPVTCIIIL